MEAKETSDTQTKGEEYELHGVGHQTPQPYDLQLTPTSEMAAMPVLDSEPSSCLWLSMIACCFFWPIGICAIKFSNEAAYAAGAEDYAAAREQACKATGTALSAIVIGIIIIIIYFVWKPIKFDY